MAACNYFVGKTCPETTPPSTGGTDGAQNARCLVCIQLMQFEISAKIKTAPVSMAKLPQ